VTIKIQPLDFSTADVNMWLNWGQKEQNWWILYIVYKVGSVLFGVVH